MCWWFRAARCEPGEQPGLADPGAVCSWVGVGVSTPRQTAASAATAIVGSPTLPKKPPLGASTGSALGISCMRIIGLLSKLICSTRPSFNVPSPYIMAVRL